MVAGFFDLVGMFLGQGVIDNCHMVIGLFRDDQGGARVPRGLRSTGGATEDRSDGRLMTSQQKPQFPHNYHTRRRATLASA